MVQKIINNRKAKITKKIKNIYKLKTREYKNKKNNNKNNKKRKQFSNCFLYLHFQNKIKDNNKKESVNLTKS